MKIVEQDGVKIYVPMNSADAKILATMVLDAEATTELPFHEDTIIEEKGGPGSGHKGHRGRPGHHGGSLPGGRHFSNIADRMLGSFHPPKENEEMSSKFFDIYGMEIDDFLNGAYNFQEGNFKTRFTRLIHMTAEDADDGIPYIHVEGTINDMTGFEHSGISNTAASFERKIYLSDDDDGEKTGIVVHSSFEIRPDYQDKDLGMKFYEQSEKAYIDAGVRAIKLIANMSVGGYAWARMGFDFDGEKLRTNMIDEFRNKLWDPHEDQFGMAFGDGKGLHAWDIASFIDKDGYKFGKSFLMNSHWAAIKYLDPKSEGYRVGQAYYAAHHK